MSMNPTHAQEETLEQAAENLIGTITRLQLATLPISTHEQMMGGREVMDLVFRLKDALHRRQSGGRQCGSNLLLEIQRDHAQALCLALGERPHNEKWSYAVWCSLWSALGLGE